MSEPKLPSARTLAVLTFAAVTLLCAQALSAQQIASLVQSSDTSLVLGGAVVDDETPAIETLEGGVSLLPLGVLPANADLEALALADGDNWLLTLDTTTLLPGGVVAEPTDVLRFDGATFQLEVDGAALGVPSGSRIDALARLPSGALVISFDTTVRLGGFVFEDEDLAELNGASFTPFFDGSASGIAASLDLDAATYDPTSNRLFLSFDASGAFPGGPTFDDEDVLSFDRGFGTWSLAYDASASHSAWTTADLDALEVQVLGSALFADGFESGDTSEWTATVP